MFYLIYKITNNINGKIYIGSHKTKNKDDKYMGSGKYLRHSIKKHGLENFVKEILFIFDNPADMYNKEKELVSELFVSREDTYNLKLGGNGGFDYINSTGKRFVHAPTKEMSLSGANRLKEICSNKESSEYAEFCKTRNRHHYWENGFKGKSHTQDVKDYISSINKGKPKELTSQYGKCWITRDGINKSIKKVDLDRWLLDGWIKGRKLK